MAEVVDTVEVHCLDCMEPIDHESVDPCPVCGGYGDYFDDPGIIRCECQSEGAPDPS